jgi:hypothetical protein
MLKCEFCIYGDLFNPRVDELERFGPDVMGCKRPHWEGYTNKQANCEHFHPRFLPADPQIRDTLATALAKDRIAAMRAGGND